MLDRSAVLAGTYSRPRNAGILGASGAPRTPRRVNQAARRSRSHGVREPCAPRVGHGPCPCVLFIKESRKGSPRQRPRLDRAAVAPHRRRSARFEHRLSWRPSSRRRFPLRPDQAPPRSLPTMRRRGRSGRRHTRGRARASRAQAQGHPIRQAHRLGGVEGLKKTRGRACQRRPLGRPQRCSCSALSLTRARAGPPARELRGSRVVGSHHVGGCPLTGTPSPCDRRPVLAFGERPPYSRLFSGSSRRCYQPPGEG